MVRENTHLAGFRGDVDLNNVLGLVDGLRAAISYRSSIVARRPSTTQLGRSVWEFAISRNHGIPGEEETSSA